nr:hypothetical protein [Tanacetum cinerariifolium]
MMLDSYINSMCLESWGRSSYARILIEINACDEYSDILVMVVPNLEGQGQIPGADDEGFIKVKRKKSGGNNECNKHFKSVSVKPKTLYRSKAKQSTAWTASSASTNKFSNKESPSNKGHQLEAEGNENGNVPLYYYITDNIKIQFRRKEFWVVTCLRFGVENLADYNDGELPILFRRRVFSLSLDGEHNTSNMVFRIIDDELFDRLHDDDAVSLCCLGILQLVSLGVEGKPKIPDWMLRLENDRVGWDNYPWGSYLWPTLYSQLKNTNVRRWPKLYATQPTTKIDKKSYSIFGYT